MREVAFSIPMSGLIRVDQNTITIVVNRAETTITYELPSDKKRISLEKGTTIFDIVLRTAKDFVRSNKENRFSAAALYYEAVKTYPDLKRNSWNSHIVACAPNHSSHHNYGVKRDYFRYLGDGTYQLSDKYLNPVNGNKRKEAEHETA